MDENRHIELKHVSKRYGYIYALRNVNLNVLQGEVLGLLGPNGSGKTTLLKLLATLTSPTDGIIEVFGLNGAKHGKEIRQKIGYVAHDPLLYKDLSGEENINFYAQFYNVLSQKEIQHQVDQIFNLLKISSWRHEPIKQLSAGLKKRFDLTRAILHDPQILLLDEPFTGLDIESVAILQKYLLSIKGVKTVFISTHNVEQAINLCDRIVLLKKGRVQHICNAPDLSSESVMSLFSVT